MAKLAAYQAKRDFEKTAEPRGGDHAGLGSAFVVQKHAATRLHYDLRLELDGVMLSWAVAKGPSLVPGEKRLAVHVEDHPIEYNGFEGTIPKGQYGGGTVLIWDRGTWEPEQDPRKGMAKGHLDFRLDGEKLHGRFHLVRLKQRPRERQESWLLIKSEDEFARHGEDLDVLEELPLSVVTGRTLEEIASDRDSAVWHSNREPAEASETAKSRSRKRPTAKAAANAPTRTVDRNAPPSPQEGKTAGADSVAPMPDAVEPCLATLVAQVPRGDKWLHEIKWDGYRLIAFKTDQGTRVATRGGHDWTTRFPGIARAIDALPVGTAVIDGEAVIEDANGVSNFSALQNALSDDHGRVAKEAIFFAFDLLYLEGHDLRPLPLDERKARLAGVVKAGTTGHLRLSEHIEAEGEAMVRSACQLGLEGVISKRRDRPYRSGRGDDWVKTKCTDRQEFVVCGLVPSTASARAVGSLVLGYHDGGRLRHAGRTGTGFSAEVARDVWRKLDKLKRATSPFSDKLTAEERRGVIWAEPTLVAEVEFRGWTGDLRLRHAAFKGLREDKSADEVVREMPDVAGAQARPKPASHTRPAPAASLPAPRSSGTAGNVAGVKLTHPDRVLWDHGITKQGLAEFYESIADWVLPHLVGRPLSLVRCPSGAGHGCFFQKHSWAGLSDHIRREMVRDEGGEEEVLYINDLPGLVSLVQAGVLEIHPWGSTIADIERPDRITMDLDPAEDVSWPDVIAAATDVRERLRAVRLESFVKTTGGKGVHVVIPLTPQAGWDEVKGFAHALALAMEADSPSRYLAKASKQARRGRIYVDYLRNGRGATAIAAYSTRARPGATISVPLAWNELSPDLKPNHYTIANLPSRLASLKRDPWADIAAVKQVLPSVEPAKPSRRRKKIA